METKKIKELIERYWDGTSSLDDEKQLREYLQSSEGSAMYPEEASLFGFYNLQREIGTNISSFPVERIEEPKIRTLSRFTKVRNIAAALLIILGAYFVWNNNITPPEQETFASNWKEVEDPKEALKITKEALAFLSNKVDKSERVLKQNIAKLSVNKILKK